ncbi:MAG: LamG-like jellyroll fold domain-containing protein [Sedimentisphaeraceae bacterium JB056]
MVVKNSLRFFLVISLMLATVNVSMALYPEPLIDSSDTVALWHFENLVPSGSYILAPDDNSTGRAAHELRVVTGNLTTGSGGAIGEALVLNGSTDWGYNYRGAAWVGHSTFQFDGLVYIDPVSTWSDTDPLGMIFEIQGVAWLRVICDKDAGTAKLEFNVWDDTGALTTQDVLDVPAGQWIRVVAEYNNGTMSVSYNDRYESIAGPDAINQNDAAKAILIGHYHGNANHFKGMLDEVRFSAPSAQSEDMLVPQVLADQPDALCLWHMNDTFLSGSYILTSDDNSTGRPKHRFRIVGDPVLYEHTEPNDLPASFDSALVFDGATNWGYGMDGQLWDGYDNITVDTLLYIDPYQEGQQSGYVFEIQNLAWFKIIWVAGSDGVAKPSLEFRCWDIDGAHDAVAMDVPVGQWFRVKADYLQNMMTMQVNDHKVALDRGKRINELALTHIFLGKYHNGGYFFDGMIDEFMVTAPAAAACGDWGYDPGDISGPEGTPDCYVNIWDLELMASQWLSSTL